ncbi:MAG: S1C family serine protease [Planctomycetia bacterium]|nr:S1C family serine protease [Planctomycetia bacterium]
MKTLCLLAMLCSAFPTIAVRDQVVPCVVRIETAGGLEKVGKNWAIPVTTGVVVGEDGWILSSSVGFAHEPSAILVCLADGSRLPAQRVGTDGHRRLALLKVTLPEGKTLPVVRVAAKTSFAVGQDCMALGRGADGKAVSLSVGILSAVERMAGLAIQTDAAISPDNYGGPLVNARGKVMGILTPFGMENDSPYSGVELYDSGVGFAIPMEDALAILPRLKEGNLEPPPALGVAFNHPNPVFSDTVIFWVQKGSLAEKQGLAKGDQILRVNSQDVRRGIDVEKVLAQNYAGDSLKIDYKRQNEEKTVVFPLTL